MKIKSVGIFCGSSSGTDPEYIKKAGELARYLAGKGIGIVYGGGNVGIMGCVASEAMKAGGSVTGVIPELIHSKVSHIDLTELHITPGMHERKSLIYRLSDAFVALPGGVGTIEEVAEAFTWQQLGYHDKPAALYNINGYYDSFIEFLERMEQDGFLKKAHRQRFFSASDPDQLMVLLENYEGGTIDKWTK